MNDTLIKIIESKLLEEQFLIEMSINERGNYIRIIIDSEDSLTLNDIADLTCILQNSKEFNKLVPKKYRLEVTTPGIERPLQYPFQYKKNINRKINMMFNDGEIIRNVTGKVMGANDHSVTVLTKKDNKSISINYDQVQSAKINVSFK